MDHKTPESMGIPSGRIEAYLRLLDDAHLSTHNVLIARGDHILFETYVPPFHRDFLHREYSVTKSFVSLAIGFALNDGLLSLDDPISKYFAEELIGQTDENLPKQTIRNMLNMATAKPCFDWPAPHFTTTDCVRMYFQNKLPGTRPGGSFFEYDSTGCFVLGALVERLTGERLLGYLRRKMLDRIGVDEKIKILTCPGGHSWGDSALLTTARNLLLCARFVLNGGNWEGEQLISPDYIRDATSALISTDNDPARPLVERNGYGYYIWKAYGQGFFFNGMGCQFALCVPETDTILIYNGDNQGNDTAPDTVLGSFYDLIVKNTSGALPEDPAAHASLLAYADSMRLTAQWGAPSSPIEEEISGRTFRLDDNPMGMTSISLTFDGTGGIFAWVNEQGVKAISFGIGENRFGKFPQTGYADQIGGTPGKVLYGCAASGAWEDEKTFHLKGQLIYDYFGNFDAVFRFSDDASGISLSFTKTAEDFLREYEGDASGTIRP